MPSSYPKALVFDAYGTLFDVFSMQQRLEDYFGDHAAQINPVWRQKQLEYTWLRSLMDRYVPFSRVTADALHFACSSVGVELKKAVQQALMKHYFTLSAFPEVPEVLARLSETYQLAILSNADRKMLEGAARNNGLAEYLKAIFSVDDVGLYKPRPEVYQMAAEGLGLAKDEIAFISSNTWDVAGAKSFGLRVIWLKRGEGNIERLGFEPDQIIQKLGQLYN